jgi:hypothetical protein
MKRIIIISLLIPIFYLLGFGQNDSLCPKIGVLGPSTTIEPFNPIPLKVALSDEAKNLKLEYKWTVNKGVIIEGQGTDSIKVAPPKMSSILITATVQIKGLPENCQRIFSETAALFIHLAYQEYKPESFLEEEKKLEELIKILSSDNDLLAILYLEFENPTSEQIDIRVLRILNYLTSHKASLKDRITFIAEKSEEDLNRIIYRYKEDEELTCSNCSIVKIIKGSEIDLKKYKKL